MIFLLSASPFDDFSLLLLGPYNSRVIIELFCAVCFVDYCVGAHLYSVFPQLQIFKAEFTCPPWFSSSAKRLVKRILDPNPQTVCEPCLLFSIASIYAPAPSLSLSLCGVIRKLNYTLPIIYRRQVWLCHLPFFEYWTAYYNCWAHWERLVQERISTTCFWTRGS